jgi:alpha-beta hydrolase superfamily lysophospholipase
LIRRFILYGFTAILLAVVGLYAVGWALSRPVQTTIGAAPPSLEAETVTFSSQSGSTIHGWLSRARARRGAILLLPGVRANRLSMVRRAEFLRQAGYSTLLIDFQGTGESEGEAITFGWRERFDVLAAVNYLKAQSPNQRVGVIGVSLGGAATLLATPPLGLDAAVLEAVYPSIDRAVVNRLSMRVGPLASLTAPLLLLQMRARIGIGASELRPAAHIAKLHCPVLIVAGSLDRHTTVEDTRLLFDAASQPKELWLIPGAAHVDYLEFAGDDYRRRISTFFERTLASTAARDPS